MNINEKINIYVPSEVGTILDRDIEMFEVYKPNGISLNWNRFLTMLIRGYYETYVQENKDLFNRIAAVLESTSLSGAQKACVTNSILNNVVRPEGNKRGGKGSRHLSLKPTADTEDLIQRIAFSSDEYLSRYFRNMLMSYCEKPFSERERIVFKENYEKLLRYCRQSQPIYLSTLWEDGIVHEVIPYTLAIGPEEMFNFLLCQEEDPSTHKMVAKAYGIRRIKRVITSDKRAFIMPEVYEHLKAMETKGPQYAINDDEEICVRLTNKGLAAYRRVYFGKPKFFKMEKREDGYYQYYRCSKDQVFLYFRKFDPTIVQIMAPTSLRNRMKCFFESGMQAYTILKDKDFPNDAIEDLSTQE